MGGKKSIFPFPVYPSLLIRRKSSSNSQIITKQTEELRRKHKQREKLRAKSGQQLALNGDGMGVSHQPIEESDPYLGRTRRTLSGGGTTQFRRKSENFLSELKTLFNSRHSSYQSIDGSSIWYASNGAEALQQQASVVSNKSKRRRARSASFLTQSRLFGSEGSANYLPKKTRNHRGSHSRHGSQKRQNSNKWLRQIGSKATLAIKKSIENLFTVNPTSSSSNTEPKNHSQLRTSLRKKSITPDQITLKTSSSSNEISSASAAKRSASVGNSCQDSTVGPPKPGATQIQAQNIHESNLLKAPKSGATSRRVKSSSPASGSKKDKNDASNNSLSTTKKETHLLPKLVGFIINLY